MPKKDNIRQMFDNISNDYDGFNHTMSLNFDKLWRRRALKEIIIPGKELQVLDLACGTGDFSIAIAEALKDGGHVTGVDLSEGMLAVMRRKVEATGLQDIISTEKGEGECLRFPDGSFDVVTIAFGIRNFEDRIQGLEEALRVLKPGGKLVILELSVPSAPVIRGLYKFYFSKVAPVIGKMISGDSSAFVYLPASVIAFPQKKEWMETMRRCGFEEVSHKAFTFGVCRMYCGRKLS